MFTKILERWKQIYISGSGVKSRYCIVDLKMSAREATELNFYYMKSEICYLLGSQKIAYLF